MSTLELSAGRISVAVSKGLMKRGEIVEIKTPNAVAAIRGTIVIAEVFPDEAFRSTISVLRGLVDVTRLDDRRRVGPSVNVGALQSVTVVGSTPLTRPTTIHSAQAGRLKSDFRIVPTQVPHAATAPAVQHAMKQATEHAKATLAAGGIDSSTSGPRTGAGDSDGTDGDRDVGRGTEAGIPNWSAKEPRKGSASGNDSVDGVVANAVMSAGNSGGTIATSALAAPQLAVDSTSGTGSGKKGRK